LPCFGAVLREIEGSRRFGCSLQCQEIDSLDLRGTNKITKERKRSSSINQILLRMVIYIDGFESDKQQVLGALYQAGTKY
jgi:hypothetical protein